MRFDFLEYAAPTARNALQVTKEGWFRDDPILTRAGIFTYRLANGQVRREYRPPEEVFNADSLASLRGVPVTLGHPGTVTADAPRGIIGTVLTAGRRDGDNLRAEIIIHNPKAIGGHREISLGYNVKLDETPGAIKGERYDAVQRRITYNHCAIVAQGRAGNARLRMDEAISNLRLDHTRLPVMSGALAAREQMIRRISNAWKEGR
ncbi:DUF2213 domain-containing protein [Pseudoroseomonas wenyumeiae]|uniref:DUF2213 domain-containing protein n=1 Tax=Teichococcus wenyumeiae TaxID=2478470 RepID=A0A3A9JD06_9PROT|nr:DUF2213 domain-containing protein [Pseudoroseomonas wenyumeiae]RKK03321.1 DUF2213 domain-containing protein [Pseudoroseomonas wenyumeiae]RMI15411.1 DUF2213 domain-containing protein [Pseudoroseomonas wenyumeiae]